MTASQILPLRHLVLRPGQPLESAQLACDSDSSTLHIGAQSSEGIVGVATLMMEPNPLLQQLLSRGHNTYRLRGMATRTDHQQKGIGRALINFGVKIIREKSGCDLLWCNARESAFLFYQRLGFEFHGDLFEIPQIGPHKVMYKEL